MFDINKHQLQYIVHHIFIPPQLPQQDDHNPENDLALCHVLHQSARNYMDSLGLYGQIRWDPIVKMLQCVCDFHKPNIGLSKDRVESAIERMKPGDILALLIRQQNAGVILRKFKDKTIFEAFEASLPNEVVMAAKGKLLCSYPGPAVEVPADIFEDPSFREEFSSFLVQMDSDILDSVATATKAGSTVVEERDTADPRYITDLLTQILLGMGEAVDVPRISKRIADDVLLKDELKPWRRSPLWLVIRVALQTSLYNVTDNHIDYKAFMVFMMGMVLRQGVESQLPSDLLFCMRAKMSRRLYKLGTQAAVPDFVPKLVQKSGEDAEKLLQERWSKVQEAQACLAFWAPETLDLVQDTRLSLSNSSQYISAALGRKGLPRHSSVFNPDSFRRFHDFDTFDAADSELLSQAFAANSHIALADFELAIQTYLDAWVTQNLHSGSASTTIAACIAQYAEAALKVYRSNSESMSLMFLTLFELWVALDKVAVAQCPLLKDYSPEVLPTLLESLLLCRSRSLIRAAKIDEYLRERCENAIPGQSTFSPSMNSSTFAVRYFASSVAHQSLKLRIESHAEAERNEKVAELQRENDSHRARLAELDGLSHKYWTDHRGTMRHCGGCRKCSLWQQASAMRINLHEWPLPENTVEAQTVVFELCPPPVFQIWRDITYRILHDICSTAPPASEKPPVQLREYVSLKNYSTINSRISLASSTMSFGNSHYNTTRIPSTESAVCVNNGLRFRLYDGLKDAWADMPFNCNIATYSTLRLGDGPYATLQYAVDSTSHSTNQVVALQSECSEDLTLHEYYAFASLRSGPRLQWLNIARELSARSLRFHREEVHTLMTQAAWQVGPLVSSEREWHSELRDAAFGCVLLQELESFLSSVETSWLQGISVRTTIILTRRLLASALDPTIVNKACSFLLRARQVTFRWVEHLVEKLQESDNEVTAQEFRHRVCEMAAICRATFDPDHLPSLLTSVEDVRILVCCAILIDRNSPPIKINMPLHLASILDDDRRLSHSLEAPLHEQIQSSRRGLDLAIRFVWPGYRQGSEWGRLGVPNEHWITSTTAIMAIKKCNMEQCVRFNLLDGRLLIDGRPLGRLPEVIANHPTYSRILGQKVLDISASDIPEMEYTTLNPICGYQVYFTMDGTDLVMRTRRVTDSDSEILELIPNHKLNNDLPQLLVTDYTHWLNVSTNEIELRPITNPWKSAPQNWRITFSADGQSDMKMCKQITLLLVDIRSPSFTMLSKSLLQLEHAKYMTVTCSSDYNCLTVDLPRFRLSFYLNDRKLLESHNWPGMVVDSDQSTGTMFGLKSQLVLRPERRELLQSRRVIVPKGRPCFGCHDDHVHVSIAIDPDTMSDTNKTRYHEYTIDTDLGRLTCHTLESKLFKVYLHAVTSHCLPDPLTERTGTQEALHDLRSAGCKSFQKLELAEIEILCQIKSLTPNRQFCPPPLSVMQSVTWSDLPPLAQHHGFWFITETIMDYAKHLRLFDSQPLEDNFTIQDPHLLDRSALRNAMPHSKEFADLTETIMDHLKHLRLFDNQSLKDSSFTIQDTHLLDRSALRNAMFYPKEFADPLPSVHADIIHASRDVSSETPDIRFISCKVHRWPTSLSTCPQLLETFQEWESKSGSGDELSLHYSRHWLHLDLAKAWISLYGLCRESSRERDRFRLEFCLSTLAYTCGHSTAQSLLPTILAFATIPQFRSLSPPTSSFYNLADGFVPQREKLIHIVLDTTIAFKDSSDAHLARLYGEDDVALTRRRCSSFETHCQDQATEIVDQLLLQWPCPEPRSPRLTQAEHSWLFDISSLMKKVTPVFQSWYWNVQYRDHIQEVQRVLDDAYLPDTIALPRPKIIPCTHQHHSSVLSVISYDSLLTRDPPRIDWSLPVIPASRESRDLKNLLSLFESSKSSLHQQYGRDLESSCRSLDSELPYLTQSNQGPSLEALTEYRDQSMTYVHRTFLSLRECLSPSSIPESVMLTAGQWPCVTRRSLLGQLANHTNAVLTDPWRRALVKLAQGLLVLQRSQRLLRFLLTQNDSGEELFKELANGGCDVHDFNADWLLLQLESHFHVRPMQAQLAREMIAPSPKQNTVFQLNMGEGKSSVIVPMVSAALADGKTLVRVVVLKSLSNQMFTLLVDRLSGLLNRRIFYMPFSRSVKLGIEQIRRIQSLYEECMWEGGVLVVQPEHILSFKLMGIDKTIADCDVAKELVNSQHWLEAHSRDILDESDEILHVRYQLVYTVGQQQTLEGPPDRWTTVQQIFSLVKRHVVPVQELPPPGIDVQDCSSGQFPSVRILRGVAGATLVSLIAQDIVKDGLRNYSFALLGERVCEAVPRFITQMEVSKEDADLLKAKCEGTSLWNGLLLLRGLLAYGILEYVLTARQYRVDYGLDQRRSLLAVPYRAKDVPALKAEFGHPDVAISLTCLNYYYQGLSKDQLDHCFQLLYKLDNPTQEYDDWVRRDVSIPQGLHQLSGVNTSDPEQFEQLLFPLFHRRQTVVDFFLSQVVFPREAKEFPKKLSASGWDIAEVKQNVTTGFSGTNDNRYLLPTSIKQNDSTAQSSTNAKVLTYLLRSENNSYLCTDQNGDAHSAKSFLGHLVGQTPEIRVLLDVGAQMLDLQNQQLAEHWLSLVPNNIPAIVFFGDNDELVVLTRDGILEPFVSSPFNQALGECLVYLDDAHTRGTDLKLPRNYRAAVTLGPKVTKDRLLQGCMRMRKLGHGQSVMFFAPREVDRKVREIAQPGKSSELDKVETLDILRWAMRMTCEDIQRHIPHWAQQGVDYGNRSKAWKRFSADLSFTGALQSSWLQVEARSLEDMYGLSKTTGDNAELIHSAFAIPDLRDRCLELGVHSLSGPQMEEEQEREVNHEVERERQIERPSRAEPAQHSIHPDVLTFVRTGLLSQLSPAFSLPFNSLEGSSPFHHVWSKSLLATADFLKTVCVEAVSSAGDYMRPVHWIVSSVQPGGTLKLVILSPYEVNEMLPMIRQSSKVHLHQYSARVLQMASPFDHLKFYCIPQLPSSWVSPPIDIRNQLSLWAGQLYLEDFATYLRLCNFLGVYTSLKTISIQADGFIPPGFHRLGTPVSDSPFTESPLVFLKKFIGLRRKGMGYLLTHLGKILHAKLLSQEDFQ